MNRGTDSTQCGRCKGRGQIAADDDPDMILSCPDCEGTGEAEMPEDETPWKNTNSWGRY